MKKYSPVGTVNTGVVSFDLVPIFKVVCVTPFGQVSMKRSFSQIPPLPTAPFAHRGRLPNDP